MTTLSDLQDEILLDLQSYGLTQPQLTTLVTPIDTDDTTLTLASVAGMAVGLIEIDSELMFVQAISETLDQLTVIRGFRTPAAAHAAGALVTASPVWPRIQVTRAINDAITSSYPLLFKVATAPFTVSGSANTYDLPAGAKVLQVRNLSIGPDLEWFRVNRYRYDADLGKLTIYDGLIAGTQLHVVYSAPPTTLALPADDLTASGLQASAKAYVVLAACAQLVTHMDSSRLPVNSAQADDMEAVRSVGSAVKIAQMISARAELELAKEQKRLREKYPVSVNISKGIR